jgi:hypothetical protein
MLMYMTSRQYFSRRVTQIFEFISPCEVCCPFFRLLQLSTYKCNCSHVCGKFIHYLCPCSVSLCHHTRHRETCIGELCHKIQMQGSVSSDITHYLMDYDTLKWGGGQLNGPAVVTLYSAWNILLVTSGGI